MQCLTLPFFKEIEYAQSILLAGAGGGFDIFSGLPLYFGLRNLGKQVYLANRSRPDLCHRELPGHAPRDEELGQSPGLMQKEGARNGSDPLLAPS
jgi:hypothetical protein